MDNKDIRNTIFFKIYTLLNISCVNISLLHFIQTFPLISQCVFFFYFVFESFYSPQNMYESNFLCHRALNIQTYSHIMKTKISEIQYICLIHTLVNIACMNITLLYFILSFSLISSCILFFHFFSAGFYILKQRYKRIFLCQCAINTQT